MQTAYSDDYPGKRKKILILGAGNAQIDLIRYCKRMGMEVLGCSYSGFDPGIRCWIILNRLISRMFRV